MIELVDDVKKLAIAAGNKILEIYADESRFGVENKADNSPLTLADKLSNDVIIEGLEKLSPQYPIISEENKEIPYEERKDFDLFWLVDPLDGTKEFIKRNGEFTVNIALIHVGEPVLGVVYVPATEEMYSAVKGHGAFYEKDGDSKRLKANTFSLEEEGLKVVCSRSHINADTQQYMDQLKQPEKVSKGSSLKFLILAEGGADLYPRLGPTMEWDTAAAQVVLEEAGGTVLEYESQQPLRYNKEVLRNPYFIAAGQMK